MSPADSAGIDTPPLEIVPLGGVGEFGMNMMVIACGDTAILVDAGVTFPEPELLGVDLIIPDFRPLERYTHRRAGPDARPRGSHRRGGARAAARQGTGLRHAVHAGAASSPSSRTPASTSKRRLVRVKPRERVTVGSFTIEFLRVTHSMPDCVALAIETPRGVVAPHRRLQDRSDAARRRARRLPPRSPSSAPRACSCCSPTAPTSSGAASAARSCDVVDAFEEIFTSAHGKIVVAMFASSIYRMQILVDLAAQFDRQVAFVGRGVIDNSEIAQRLGYLRIPAGVQIRDSDVQQLSGAGRGVHLHRLAGRAAGGAVAHRHRRPPARQARPRRRGGVLGAGDSRATRRRSAG